MRIIISIILYTILAFQILVKGSGIGAPGTLKAVQVLLRHGDREPDTVEGFGNSGQLTEKGKKEMYEAGLYLRKRYEAFVKPTFDPDEVVFISSATDRTISSASLLSHGFYHGFHQVARWNQQRGKRTAKYEPIPIRSIPAEIDKYLQCSQRCKRYSILVEETVFDFLTELSHNNTEFFAKAEEMGYQFTTNDSKSALAVGSNFAVFRENVLHNITYGLPVLDWAMELVDNGGFSRYTLNGNLATAATPEERMFFTGPLLKLLLENFQARKEKITFFLGHDRILHALMLTLDVWDSSAPDLPPTGAALFIELHEILLASRMQLIVELWYRNDTAYQPRLLKIPKCGDPCPLLIFKEAFQDFLPYDYEAQCELD